MAPIATPNAAFSVFPKSPGAPLSVRTTCTSTAGLHAWPTSVAGLIHTESVVDSQWLARKEKPEAHCNGWVHSDVIPPIPSLMSWKPKCPAPSHPVAESNAMPLTLRYAAVASPSAP